MVPTQLVQLLKNQTNIVNINNVQAFSKGQAVLQPETCQPWQSGLLVDYLTRLFLTNDPQAAFAIPLKTNIDAVKTIVSHIKPEYDYHTVKEAALTLPFDQLYRRGVLTDDPPKLTDQDCRQILQMTDNALALLNVCQQNKEDKVKTDIEFSNAFNDLVTNADADYMTNHVLIDMKVSKYPPYPTYWLQLIIYYIIGLHSNNHAQFEHLTHFAIINPRLAQIYTYQINNLHPDEFTKLTKLLHY